MGTGAVNCCPCRPGALHSLVFEVILPERIDRGLTTHVPLVPKCARPPYGPELPGARPPGFVGNAQIPRSRNAGSSKQISGSE